MSDVFSRVGRLRPRRSVFDLSYNKLGTCTFGELIPVMCDEIVPGDTFQIGAELIIRFSPLVAPILHEINATIHYFFVPYRLLTNWTLNINGQKLHRFDWELFISGGLNGSYNEPLPRWIPRTEDLSYYHLGGGSYIANQPLWDMFGFPPQTSVRSAGDPIQAPLRFDVSPLAFPLWAYNLVYAEYYADQDLDVQLHDPQHNQIQPAWDNRITMFRRWQKDYFTAARPWQQRGDAPAFPMRGILSVGAGVNDPDFRFVQFYATSPQNVEPHPVNVLRKDDGYIPQWQQLQTPMVAIDQGGATFNVQDLRTVVQIQKWMERNARSGIRYIEFLRAHFGVSPSDARLDRPEYIGGVHAPIIISEVLQTSQSQPGAPQGDMAGHGLSASSTYVGSYFAEEYGLILGLLSVMPKPLYQQGINRQWLRYSRYDFYFPEFAHFSEQGIYRAELYWYGYGTGTNITDWEQFSGAFPDSEIFGFVGRYDEMRVKHDMTVGEMRYHHPSNNVPDMADWHLGRNFYSQPVISSEFVSMVYFDGWHRSFAIPSVRPIIFHVRNKIRAVRPMPAIAEPGLVDHF